ncbi:TIGR04211 family SH3 domain-containing protein, partial [Oleiphilus sp. HI0067]
PSGTAIEIIEQNKETGYSFVRTKGGTEGYLPTRYLSAEPIAKAKLAKAEKELNQLRTSNKDLNTKLNALQGNFNALEKDHAQTSKTLNANNTELARVKSVSADALNLDRSNRELRESNEELRNQLELLEVENARLKDKSESNMMLIGGALVLLGVILALIVPLLKPSKKNDSWA